VVGDHIARDPDPLSFVAPVPAVDLTIAGAAVGAGVAAAFQQFAGDVLAVDPGGR
jgi:hypothetical protein